MLTFKPAPALTAIAAVALVILIMLGSWQWARYTEKMAARVRAPAVVEALIAEAPRGPVQFVYGVLDGRAGWRILTPIPDGLDAVLFVDGGFAPGLAPPDRASLPPSPAIAVGRPLRGIALTPRPPGPFAAKSDASRGLWYAMDLPAMARAAGYARAKPYVLAAPYLGVDGRPRPNPFAAALDPLPPERHIGYAVTWWGLAAGLVVIYVLMHARSGRLSLARRPAEPT